MAPFNGAVAGTFPGLEAGVGIGFQPRILSYGAVSSGVGPSEDPESWLIPLECAQVLDRIRPGSRKSILLIGQFSFF